MFWKYLTTLLAVLGFTAAARAELKIVTTATDYADIARQIGKDKVEVHSVMKGPENVHNVLAKPTEMVFLNKADLFVHSGLDAEPWRDNLLLGARNPKVMPGQSGNVDMSTGLELLEVPTGKIDRSMGDVHAYGNPHYTTSPKNAQRMALTLVQAMSKADPANAEFYKANAVTFVREMGDTYKQLLAELKPYAGLKIATYHAAWDYFADAFGLQIAATIEPKPSITPSPADLAKVIQTLKAQGVKVVIVETYNSYKEAKAVADAAGAVVVQLPDHVSGKAEADSYQNLFRHDVRQILATAKAAGVQPKGNP